MTRYTDKVRINREVMDITQQAYGGAIHIFDAKVPSSVKVDESHYMCMPVLTYDPKGKVAESYRAFCKEYLDLA